jgi:hypothetical protein
LVPLHVPDALHVVALVELHVSVEAPPDAMEPGFAVRVTVGTGTMVTVTEALTLPPVPEQLNE